MEINMESNDDRVLAYTLAKEISHKELDKVAGAGMHATHYTTFRLTGANYDGTLDFNPD